jgi:hypothetical protein
VVTNVSDELTASVFTLKMEASGSIKTLVTVYKTTGFPNPEDDNPSFHSHDNFKYYMTTIVRIGKGLHSR